MPESVITGIFTILGIAIGGFIGYATSVKVSDRKELQKAAIDFHEAFLDALMSLDQKYFCRETTERNVYEILQRTFPQQMKAMLRFRLYLPANKRETFDKAWYEYCHYDVAGGPEYPFLEQYFEKTWEGQPTRELALRRIEKLMSFVELAHKPPLTLNVLANKALHTDRR
jgi:hypothetical protein